jgi:hypothetical protein
MRNERIKFFKQLTKVLLEEERKSTPSCIIENYETLEGGKSRGIKII